MAGGTPRGAERQNSDGHRRQLYVLAGKMERAPKWMQDASLEWAFRLYKQPSRFMRMMALPKFVIKVMASKF